MGLEFAHVQISGVASIANGITWPDSPSPQILWGSVALLIASEARSFYAGSALFKTTASLAFLIAGVRAALARGTNILDWTPPTDRPNQVPLLLVAGLVLSVFGDILLIPSHEAYYAAAPTEEEGQSPRFKAGTFCFALAHVVYIGSFVAGAPRVRWAEFAGTLLFGAATVRWLGIMDRNPGPNALFAVPEDMRALVTVYLVIIWTMVATATATDTGFQNILGGWIFMTSDLFVASDVFGPKKANVNGYKKPGQGRQGWKARGIGWIAYFGAQLVLAGSI